MNFILLEFDFYRIFFGDSGYDFLLEIIFRTLIMYLYCIFILRIFGKRGMGQVSNLELAIIIAFGSAVGDPMIYDDVPILYGMVAITTIAILQIILEKYINRNKKLEEFMEGSPKLVVNEGIIVMNNAHKEVLSREDIFRMLREKDVEQLGQIKKAFFETSGQMSVMFMPPKKMKHGLSIIPHAHKQPGDIILNGAPVKDAGLYACQECGLVKSYEQGQEVNSCINCGGTEWSKAVI